MQVETFECTETAAEPIEATEEALSIIEELGLTGQQELNCKNEKSGRDTRCPYREITADERFVYKTICPTESKLCDYKASPIPLRVLQVAAHAKSLGVFRELYVWDKVSVTEKDPVLIGRTGTSEFDSGGKTFILARWGEELETFVVLLKRSIEIARKKLIESGEAALAEAKSASDDKIVSGGPGRTIYCPV